MQDPRRRALLGVGIVVAAALAVVLGALVTLGVFAEDPDEAAGRYVAAWTRGDDRAAARETDQPEAARLGLEDSRRGLDGARVKAEVASVDEDGDDATARLKVSWRVPRVGTFSYDADVPMREGDDGWQVVWRAQNVHPKLTEKTRLGTVVAGQPRAPILDRDGQALVRDRPVTDIAVRTDRVEDAADTASRLAALVDVDAERLERTILDAGPGKFVPVITLRQARFQRDQDALRAIPGVSINGRLAPLAPNRAFGRAVLGVVGPATAEQVEESRGRVRADEEVGQWGLQAAFDERLAGTATGMVVVRDRKTGEAGATLLKRPGRRGQALRTTLDRTLQAAAEEAMGDVETGALVAVQPSTGDVLAVSNRPVGSSMNRAFDGLYPPGSTFKVVTTAALLRDGLTTDEVVDCPATETVDGRRFRNFEGGASGAVPFSEDFAESCNTAFVSLNDRITSERLSAVARDFGLGRELKLPVGAAQSEVPAAEDDVGRAAMMIGQAETVASPLAMAGVAGTVAEGRWRIPRLVSDDPRRAGRPLATEEADTLRTLMRTVVTSGTGTALAAVPGEPAGKSGTAEYGDDDPPKTHAWFIAFRGDLAVAVLVEGGRAGGEVAAPIAASFLTAAPLE